MGVDLFSSVVWGARSTLLIAIATAAVGLIVGMPVGLYAGYKRKWVGTGLMRLADISLALPQILIAIIIIQAMGPSLTAVIIALSVTYWPFWARLAYAETKSVCNEIYIEAAIALGVPAWRVAVLHILPAIASSLIVRTAIGVGAAILSAATLGFLGLGAPPPSPEWGRLISESRDYLPEAWWYPLAPGVAIFITVFGFYLTADGLRDVLDPNRKGDRAGR
jgi:peptide/nickel transport system permease protein